MITLDVVSLDKLVKLQKTLGYRFEDINLLRKAMIHSGKNATINNENLEFLGDRVVGLSIAQQLYTHFPAMKEGDLAYRLSRLVSTESLADLAADLNLGDTLIYYKSGQDDTGIFADAFEALIGAVFLDAGFDRVHRLLQGLFEPLLDVDLDTLKDPKTLLQEYLFAQKLARPEYFLIQEEGTHSTAPLFTMGVRAAGQEAQGQGRTKKKAEKEAAQALLLKLDPSPSRES